MYCIYVSADAAAVDTLEEELQQVDNKKLLLAVANGYDLIQFLQNVKQGESYPDLIILGTDGMRLSGRELLELLKTDDIYRLIPVVMFVREQDISERDYCLQIGTETISAPADNTEWKTAARKISAAFN